MRMNKIFKFRFSNRANSEMRRLENDSSQAPVLKAVGKSLNYMSINLRHPSLNTHEFHGRKGLNGEKIFESYAQNNTSRAYRIFWHYGPEKDEITIVDITAHP